MAPISIGVEVVHEVQSHPWSRALSRSTMTILMKFRTAAMPLGEVRGHAKAWPRMSSHRKVSEISSGMNVLKTAMKHLVMKHRA
eukprot:1145715-Alexandrium_andersonii.AAC.1